MGGIRDGLLVGWRVDGWLSNGGLVDFGQLGFSN